MRWTFVVLACFAVTFTSAATWNVPADFATIQAAIDGASDGDTIEVAAGTYDATFNIEGRSGLAVVGLGSVLVQPTTSLDFNVGTYGSSRKAVIRIVESTDVFISNITFDLDLVKANFMHGFLFWNSTGTLSGNIFMNLDLPDATGGYYEIGGDIRGPGYAPGSTTAVFISGNTFIDTGRIGVVTHDYVSANISGNTFYKTTDDFGYAIEIGGPSVAVITNNTIYGFDTPALSDGSESAGIYVESAWTTAISSPYTKQIVVEGNEIYDSQYGLWVGNGYDGFAGDVDIVVQLASNNIHDNTDGGVFIQDEDASAGSSVTLTGSGNQFMENGSYGYYIYSAGDGNITVNLTNEVIAANDVGVGIYESAPGSLYSVTVSGSDLGRSTTGVDNQVTGLVVNAENNWWGSITGPYHPTANPGGQGCEVSDGVDFEPLLQSLIVKEDESDCDNAVVTVNLSSPEPVQAYSFGVLWDATMFDLVSIDYAGLSAMEGLNSGSGPQEFFMDTAPVNNCDDTLTGAAAVYCIASSDPVDANVLPAGDDQPVVRFTFSPATGASLGDSSPIKIVGCLHEPPWNVKLTVNFATVVPYAVDGWIHVRTCMFIRGDSNHDTGVDISDAVCVLSYLFSSVGEKCPNLSCLDAADANDDGSLDIGDAVKILSYLFKTGLPLPTPFPGCGMDPTLNDALPCEHSVCN